MGMAVKRLLFLAFVFGAVSPSFGQPRYEQSVSRADEGGKMLTQLRQYGEHPRYGKCWTTALEQINKGCKRLTDDEQSYLALTFANCHLEKAGMETYPCEEKADIRNCLQQLKGDAIAFSTYTEFFTHTQDICFFLQSQVWHEQTEETVVRLARSSEDVADKMETAGQLQEEMIKKQGESLSQQELILQNEEKLKETLHASSQDIKDVFAEMKHSTQSQKRLFEETFSRVGDIQHLILGEFSWFNSLLFFAAAMLIAYLVTSTPRTSGARLWLFISLGAEWIIERAVFQINGQDQTQLYQNMWLCRKLWCLVAVMVVCLFAYRYKDLVAVNNALLLEIKRQNSELCRVVKGIGVSSYPALGTNSVSAAIQSSSTGALALVTGHSKPISIGRDYSDSSPRRIADTITTIDGYSSDDFTSTDTDPTFAGAQSSDTDELSDTESFTTANQPSRPGSRRVSQDGRMNGRLPSATNDSFMQGFNQSDVAEARYIGSATTVKRKPGRPKGSRSRESTPRNVTPPQTRYNLRTRTPQSATNPILNKETVEMFIERIGAALGQRTYRAERVEPASYSRRRNHVTSFSSDDEF